MAYVNFDVALDFCANFKAGYLEPVKNKADEMKALAIKINNAMNGTSYATKSQEEVIELAKKIALLVDIGEQRILELERRFQSQKDRGTGFTR